MSKTILGFLVLFYSIIIAVTTCQAADNIAKGKSYIVSPTQNYRLSASSSDKTALTDGNYTIGRFWTQKTTVGWQRVSRVELLIDLEKDFNIGSVVFSSARGEGAGVNYPKHVSVFIGSDREHMAYVGDLANDPANRPGSYHTQKFKLNNVGMRGRYVLLEVIPDGAFLFCDEVEVLEGKLEQHQQGNFSLESAREFSEQLILQPREKERLSKMADNLIPMVGKQIGLASLNNIKEHISELKTLSDADAIETDLLALRGVVLAKQFPPKKMFHVQSINPWIPLNPVSPISDAASSRILLIAPKNGYGVGAALITNLSTRSMLFTIKLEKISEDFNLNLNQVPFIKTAALESVADPLVPVDGPFSLRAGESRMVFVTAIGKKSGNWSNTLLINGGGNVKKLPITLQISSVVLSKKLSLNSVNWAYLDFKLVRDRQREALQDLLEHHTNVVVVPPQYLPNADPVKPMDFSLLESYLKLHKGVDKVLLFKNMKGDDLLLLGGGYPFLGEQWKTAVKRWCEGAWQAAARVGYKADDVYWYPFDEMKDKEIEQFIDISKWAKIEIPSVKFYATLGNKDSERALPYLDIAQIVDNDNELRRFSGGNAEKWIYNAISPAKSISSYSYYRLMAWKAFLNDYKGIGFWAYADAGVGDNPGKAWDDFDGMYPDYAVIYEGAGTSIISSRRWEGWRMGIEDYELLTMYAKQKGEVVAKALAKKVLDNPEDLSIADETRRKILKELSN